MKLWGCVTAYFYYHRLYFPLFRVFFKKVLITPYIFAVIRELTLVAGS